MANEFTHHTQYQSKKKLETEAEGWRISKIKAAESSNLCLGGAHPTGWLGVASLLAGEPQL